MADARRFVRSVDTTPRMLRPDTTDRTSIWDVGTSGLKILKSLTDLSRSSKEEAFKHRLGATEGLLDEYEAFNNSLDDTNPNKAINLRELSILRAQTKQALHSGYDVSKRPEFVQRFNQVAQNISEQDTSRESMRTSAIQQKAETEGQAQRDAVSRFLNTQAAQARSVIGNRDLEVNKRIYRAQNLLPPEPTSRDITPAAIPATMGASAPVELANPPQMPENIDDIVSSYRRPSALKTSKAERETRFQINNTIASNLARSEKENFTKLSEREQETIIQQEFKKRFSKEEITPERIEFVKTLISNKVTGKPDDERSTNDQAIVRGLEKHFIDTKLDPNEEGNDAMLNDLIQKESTNYDNVKLTKNRMNRIKSAIKANYNSRTRKSNVGDALLRALKDLGIDIE